MTARLATSFLLAFLFLGATVAVAGGFSTYQTQQDNELAKDLPQNPDFDYLSLDPVFLPVDPDKGQTQQITVTVVLELPAGTKDDARVFVPRLDDAYTQSIFNAIKSDRSPRRGNDVDAAAIKKIVADVTTGIMGEGKVSRVLVRVQAVLK